MQLAKPAHAADQVAAVVGVKPALNDPGQPMQLALSKPDVRPSRAAAPVSIAVAQAAADKVPAAARPVAHGNTAEPAATAAALPTFFAGQVALPIAAAAPMITLVRPGISAFAAAAAALGRELTLPGVSQTVILTRTAVRASATGKDASPGMGNGLGPTFWLPWAMSSLSRRWRKR